MTEGTTGKCCKKRAILAVSFGTSYTETRKKTIDQIEADIREAYPEYPLYRAWTSGMIRRKLEKRDGIRIPDVRGAMEQMKADGITEVIVQPTHVLNGIENEQMTQDVLAYGGQFEKLVIGAPLLTTQEDSNRAIRVIGEELALAEDEVLVLMGHGTPHFSNAIYAALDYQFKDEGYPNIFMGTVEAYPAFESLLKKVKSLHPKRVVLAPFMIVAGDHASNDLAGEDEDSWKSRFEREGYEVACVLKGLGEYPGIRAMFLDHVRDVMDQLQSGE